MFVVMAVLEAVSSRVRVRHKKQNNNRDNPLIFGSRDLVAVRGVLEQGPQCENRWRFQRSPYSTYSKAGRPTSARLRCL